MDNLFISIMTGLYFFIVGGLPMYGVFAALKQPLIVGFFIGLLTGDMKTSMIVAGSVEMVYLGMISAGGNIPSDKMLAALVAVPIAVTSKVSPEVAVSIAVPVGILGVFVNNIRRTVNAKFADIADKYAENENVKGLFKCAFIYPMFLGFFLRFPVVFVANYFGMEFVNSILNTIPKWLLNGLIVAGGILPAIGFATTIFVISKNKYLPLFIIGFFLVKYLALPTTAIAIFGVCIALLMVNLKEK